MRKINLAALVAGLILALSVAGVNAQEQMAGPLGRAFGANEILGVPVKNLQGETVGTVTDFIVDAQGRIGLIILIHGGFLGFNAKEAAVPFSSFRYEQADNHLILDVSKEKMAAAPVFKRDDLSDPTRAESLYRYFGQQPYWSEGGEPFKGLEEPLEEEQPSPDFIGP